MQPSRGSAHNCLHWISVKLSNDQDFIFLVAPGGVSNIDIEAKYTRLKETAVCNKSRVTLL